MTAGATVAQFPSFDSYPLLNMPKPHGQVSGTGTSAVDDDGRRFFGRTGDSSAEQPEVPAEAMYRLCEIVSRLSREAVPWAQALQEHTAAPTEPIRRSLRSLSAARRELRGLPVRCTLWGEEIDADVLDFCSRESLLDYLPLALELVGECFPSARALRVQVEQDPETDDEWLTLNFTVHGETDDILDQHDEYTDRWISAVPWPESDKICLCYEVA